MTYRVADGPEWSTGKPRVGAVSTWKAISIDGSLIQPPSPAISSVSQLRENSVFEEI